MNRIRIAPHTRLRRRFDQAITVQRIRIALLTIDDPDPAIENGATERPGDGRGNVGQQHFTDARSDATAAMAVDDAPEIETEEGTVVGVFVGGCELGFVVEIEWHGLEENVDSEVERSSEGQLAAWDAVHMQVWTSSNCGRMRGSWPGSNEPGGC